MIGPFDHFRQVMTGPFAPQGVNGIAEFLEEQARQACMDRALSNAEIYCGRGLVTMLLTERDAWEAVIVGPNAYQLYPGFIRDSGEGIVWPNIWVADDYDLDEFVLALEEAFEQAARQNK
ncbi:MAG: hypothetical protein ABL973_09275 [Micropepsaceae bacterium]